MLGKMSLFKKLLVANCFYAVPIVILVYLMVQTKTENIKFAQWELKGNRYQHPLEEILEGIADHKLVAQRAIYGDAQSKDRIAGLDTKIDQGFARLDEVDKDVGEDLQFTDEGLAKRKRDNLKLSKVKAHWEDLKKKNSGLSASDSNDEHAKLIGEIRGMIAHAGDTSNLILDPDLDSYYLMDATLVAYPQLQDRLQDITGVVEGILRRRNISAKERIDLAVYAALLKQSDIDRINGDAQTSLQEDQNFYQVSKTLQANLPPAMEQLTKSMEEVIGLITKIASDSKVQVSPDQFLNSIGKAQLNSFRTWEVSVQELDTLLSTRVHFYESSRFWSIFFAGLALAVCCMMLFGVARSFNTNMTRVLRDLKISVAGAKTSGTELVTVSNELSNASNDQASAIQETVSTLDEINAMVSRTLESAARSSNTAQTSHTTAQHGKDAVGNMVVSIQDISNSNDEIMSKVEDGNNQISEITKIIAAIADRTKIINDIVFQTKLLSFNASVEAARAGEHGKGFAVVAEEVGNLAQMSGNASKEIASMLETSIQKVEQIVSETRARLEQLMRLGKSKVEAGTSIAGQCGKALEEIVSSVGDVRSEVTQITNAAEEQARGVSEITKAMQKLDDTTHQNATMAGHTAKYSEDLSKQAEALELIVTTLEEQVLGKSVNINELKVAPKNTKKDFIEPPKVELSPFGAPKKAETKAPAKWPNSAFSGRA